MAAVSDTTSKPASSGWQLALGRATATGQYLGSPEVVQSLVKSFTSGLMDRYREVCEGRSTPWDAAEIDREQCARMAHIFSGKEGGFTSMGEWNDGGGLGRFLARHLEKMIAPGDLASPDAAIMQAFAFAAHGVYEVLGSVQSDADLPKAEGRLDAITEGLSQALLGVNADLFVQ